MFLLQAPEVRDLEVFTTMPAALRRAERSDWADANRGGTITDAFLEGPVFDEAGNLYVSDIPWGRIFRIDTAGAWSLVAEYDGEPNGMKFLDTRTLLITDYKNGLMRLDVTTGQLTPHLQRRNSERFKGVNDLVFDAVGNLYFTDQGQTGLHDASGKVYRWSGRQTLSCVLDHLPSPNGLRVSPDGRELFVCVTRDNSVWRAPLMASGEASKVGRFAMFYGPTGPDGLHLDSRGLLWVCLPGADAIWILDAQAQIVGRVRFPRGAFPSNLVLDESAGKAWVTCSGLQSIFQVSFDFT